MSQLEPSKDAQHAGRATVAAAIIAAAATITAAFLGLRGRSTAAGSEIPENVATVPTPSPSTADFDSLFGGGEPDLSSLPQGTRLILNPDVPHSDSGERHTINAIGYGSLSLTCDDTGLITRSAATLRTSTGTVNCGSCVVGTHECRFSFTPCWQRDEMEYAPAELVIFCRSNCESACRGASMIAVDPNARTHRCACRLSAGVL